MFFLGIGTGRCGSMSLQHILNEALSASKKIKGHITHENTQWRNNNARAYEVAKIKADDDRLLAGDIAAYWLPLLPQFLSVIPREKLKLVLMVRDKEQFIQSLEERWGDNNKFTRLPRKGWLKHIPYIPGKSIRECADKYWKDYNSDAIKYDPYVMQTSDLNDDAKLDGLFEYLGIDARVYPRKRRYNVRPR
jgi:hypothetical protein